MQRSHSSTISRLAVSIVITCLLWAVPAAAQSSNTSIVDLTGGPAWWLEDDRQDFGVAASVAVHPFRSRFGIVGDFGYYDGGRTVLLGGRPFKESARYSLMGGVRVRFPVARAIPFAHLLLGHAPLDDFALQPGGGIAPYFPLRR